MNLSLRDFTEIVSILRPGERGASEQRRASRTTVCARLSTHLLEGNRILRSYSLLTRDISLSGIGVFQAMALPAKSELLLELPRAAGSMLIRAMVMHCRPMADNIFAVGITFTETASAELIDALAKSRLAPEERIRNAILD